MRPYIPFALLIPIITIAGCDRSPYSFGGATSASDSVHIAQLVLDERVPLAGSASEWSMSRAQEATSNEAMLARSGTVGIEVDSLEVAVSRATALVDSVGGRVASATVITGQAGSQSATFELRVPAPRMDATVALIRSLGRVQSIRIGAVDVGTEHVDLVARLGNAKRLEERLLRVLAEQTGTIEEILEVERAVGQVREQIERYEAHGLRLETQVAMSTLTVVLQEPSSPLGPPAEWASIIGALGQAGRHAVTTIAVLIEFLGVAIPLAGVALGVWWAAKSIRRWVRVSGSDRVVVDLSTPA